jgi:tetratricopeptide (TPR) repeat protein
MRIASAVLLPTLLAVFAAGTASAQDACPLDESRFARQILAIQQARTATSSDQVIRHVTTAVRDLASRADFPAERAYLLAQAYTAWINRADLSHDVTRGQIGLSGEPSERLDLEQQIDSLFTAVEAARPGCAEPVEQLRRSEAWVRLITTAFEQYQREELDAAEASARRSLRLFAGMPYAYNILAGVAQTRGQHVQAVEYLKESVQRAEGDTAFAEIYQQALYGIAGMSAELAEQAEGQARDQLLQQSRDAFQRLLAAPGVSEEFAAAARQGLARAAVVSGDTSAVRSQYAQQLENPDAFDFRTLLVAGSIAAEVDQMDDALKLLEAAQAKNPFHRDVLANLVFLYARSGTPTTGLPAAERLMSVDPGNPESHRLVSQAYAAVQRQLTARARAYAQRAGSATNARARAAFNDSAQALSDSISRMSDLAVRYLMSSDSLPARVTVTGMAIGEGEVTLRGTIQNSSSSAATYSTRVDLLDATGNVVGGQDVTVGPVQPGAAERFTVTVNANNVAAFRYSPLMITGQ